MPLFLVFSAAGDAAYASPVEALMLPRHAILRMSMQASCCAGLPGCFARAQALSARQDVDT